MNVNNRFRAAAFFGGIALLGATLAGCATSASSDVNVVGTWGDPSAAQEPSLEFDGEADAGRYAGTDGCNSLAGEYTLEGDGTVDLGMMVSTKMYCEGIDDWLSFASTASVDGETMTFFDRDGAEIGSLSRS